MPARLLLCDFLRGQCGAKGVHVGCEHGVCGACTILIDGRAVRSCLMFAVQGEGTEVKTVASLGEHDSLSLQQAFLSRASRAAVRLLHARYPNVRARISGRAPGGNAPRGRRLLAGHLCRCTGYTPIVDAIMATKETAG